MTTYIQIQLQIRTTQARTRKRHYITKPQNLEQIKKTDSTQQLETSSNWRWQGPWADKQQSEHSIWIDIMFESGRQQHLV